MKVLIAVLQALLMLVAGVAAMFWRPFGITHTLWRTDSGIRTFELDWVIAVVIVYLLLLVIALLRKRIKVALPWTTLALALSLLAGFALKLGFKTTPFF